MTPLLLLSALIASAVPLDEDPDFSQARQLYDELEFEQAIFRLQDAALVEGRTPQDRARVFVWLGVCYGQTGKSGAARRAFDDAVGADVDVALPVPVAPELEQLLEQSRGAERERIANAPPPPDNPPIDQEPPAPTDPVPAAADADDDGGMSGLRIASLSVAGLGAALAVGGAAGAAGLGAVTYVVYSQAADPQTTQVDAVAALNIANITAYSAVAAFGVAAASTAVGVVGLTTGLLVE